MLMRTLWKSAWKPPKMRPVKSASEISFAGVLEPAAAAELTMEKLKPAPKPAPKLQLRWKKTTCK